MNSTSRKNKICAVIPFYNEEATIKEIINKTLNYADFVICIDDGSNDKSQKLLPVSDRVIVLRNDSNKGKGYSLRIGLKKSIELNSKYTITLDADFQHPPEYIPFFIQQLSKYDMVIGNRLKDLVRMPFQRILSNKITSKLLSLKTGIKIPDSQCGYRGFRTNVLDIILPLFNGFEAESEMIVKAAKCNLRIGFTTVPTIYENEKSKIHPLQTIKGFIKVLFI